MAIKFSCPNSACARPLTVKDEYVGRTGVCPACSVLFTVAANGVAEAVRSETSPRPHGAASANSTTQAAVVQSPTGRQRSTSTRRMSKPPTKAVADFEVLDDLEANGPLQAKPPRAARSGRDIRTPSAARPAEFEVIEDDPENNEATATRGRRRNQHHETLDEDEDLDSQPLSRGSRGDWDKVRLGLTLDYYAVCALLGGVAALLGGVVLLILIAKIFGPSPGEVPSRAFVNVLLVLLWGTRISLGLGGLTSAILGCIGLALGCWAPSRHSAKTLGIATASLTAAGLLLVPLSWVFPGVLATLLLCCSNLTQLAASFTFLFYLRALCLNIKARPEASSVVHLLIGQAVFVAFAGLVLGLAVLTAVGASLREGLVNVSGLAVAFIVLGFILFIAALVVLAWFMNVLVGCLKVIERRKLGSETDWNDLPLWVILYSLDIALWVILIIIALIIGQSVSAGAGVLAPAFEQGHQNSLFPPANANPAPAQQPFPEPSNPFQRNSNPFGQNPGPFNQPGPFRPPMTSPGPFGQPPMGRPPFRH